jgi:two-component system, OmpR family, sensor histidine kinase MtrB
MTSPDLVTDSTEQVPDARPVPRRRPARRYLPLRLRAALAFGLMALLLSSTLSFAAYVLVRSSLLGERQIVAERQAYTNARLLRARVDPLPPDMSQLLAGLQVGGSGDSLLRIGNEWYSSSVQITSSELPSSLSAVVEQGDAATQMFERFGSPVLAVGVPINAVDAEYFEISSLQEVESALSRLGRSLFVAGGVATVLGGLLGAGLSSAILQPLRRFALVAERITSGDSTSRPEQVGPATTRLDAAGDADLEPLAASFNEMLDELDERIERERRFASDVSHEIRGPVAALASALSIVDRRRDQLPTEIVPVVDALDEQVKAFNRLVLDLLEISRFDARTAVLETSTTDLREVCEQILQSRGHDDVALIATGPVEAEIDRRRFEQVLSNLLENATHYAGGATHVLLEHVDHGPGRADRIRIRVEDRGPGVAPAERDAIFGRFQRGRAADAVDSPRGTGLGLALTRQHVELHGGRVWVEDRAGGGASFVVELPRNRP